MSRRLSFGLLIAFISWTASALSAEVSIEGRRILADGTPFFARGVCYAPNPIGARGDRPPYGDYFTPTHQTIYERDLPRMRQMGINCIRTYGWTTGADHSDFLDQAYNDGNRPIRILINRWVNPDTAWDNAGAVNAIAAEWASIAREVRDHPALLGYLIGNELPSASGNAQNPAFWAALNTIAGAIRDEDPDHLITTPLADVSPVQTISAVDPFMANLNVWSIQAYRGRSFGDLIPRYAGASGKPLLVTEFGLDAYDRKSGSEFADNARIQAEYLGSLWGEMVSYQHIVSGGFVFAWVDEWWKAGSATSQDSGGWANLAFPDGYANEEWWGIHSAASVAGQPDQLRPRAAVDALRRLWTAELSLLHVSDNQIGVQLTGPPWQEAVLQRSTNWLDWVGVATNTLPFTQSIDIEEALETYFRAELE